MLLEDFKEQAKNIEEDDFYAADSLCFRWLETALMDKGKVGEIGISLLSIIRNKLMDA